MKKRSIKQAAVPLRDVLEPLFVRYNRPEFLSSDPLEFPHRFSDPWDQEVVAIFSAVLAYGNVRQIRRSAEDLLRRIRELERTPAEMIRSLSTTAGRAAWSKALEGFVHRFNVGDDFYALSLLIARSWRESGSVGAHLSGLMAKQGPEKVDSFGPALSELFVEWDRWRAEHGTVRPSFAYLLTPPALGSACKRWCMLLRWMVRKDALDLGLWRAGSPLLPTDSPGILPRQLVMPLDTHTGRISQYIGLTNRKSLGWKAASEITERLRECDPDDPVRYDFALARLGILDVCQRRFRVEICMGCDLVRVCRFARKGLSSQASRSTRS